MVAARSFWPVLAGALLLSSSGFAQVPVAEGAPPAPANTSSPITVVVNGRPLSFGDSPPQSVGGRLLVPLRAIFEALGARVDFSEGFVRARRASTALQLQIGSREAVVNGQTRTLDVPAQAIFGRTFVPLRFVGEALGAQVAFNTATQTVSITSPDGNAPSTDTGLPYTAPTAGQAFSGTLVAVNAGAPATVSVQTGGTVRTLAVNEGALVLRQNSLAPSATAKPVRQPPRPTSLSSLAPGETVRVTLDSTGRVSQLTAQATVVLARVQYGAGNQIILDDANDTTLTLGPDLSYVDANGRPSNTANLNAGARVALFLSPQGRTIYRVSSDPRDTTITTLEGPTDPLPTGSLPPANAPTLGNVQTDAKTPLKAGATLSVSARATTGQRLTWSLGSKIQNQPLEEDANQPGLYRATYTIKPGDDVLAARVSVRLQGANGFEATAQSQKPVTIDTVAPRLIGTFPANGATIRVAQPNIAIFADDLGGSGLGEASVSIVSNGTTTPIPTTLAPPTSVNAVPPQALSGRVQVRALVKDKAGNTLPVNFSFTVAGNTGAGAIQSFIQGANRAMAPGEDVPLQLVAAPAGKASYDVLDSAGKALQRDVPMSEDADIPGTYRASFRIPDDVTTPLRFIGKFDPGDGQVTTQEATAPVQIAAAPTQLSITSPTDGATGIGNQLVVQGKAAPGATVSVSVTAQGTRFFVLQYSNDLGTFQARADAQGNWKTEPIPVARPKGVANLTLSIAATQTDNANRTSDPVTISVAP